MAELIPSGCQRLIGLLLSTLLNGPVRMLLRLIHEEDLTAAKSRLHKFLLWRPAPGGSAGDWVVGA